jgi:Fe-S cluster assembly ATPase SufC
LHQVTCHRFLDVTSGGIPVLRFETKVKCDVTEIPAPRFKAVGAILNSGGAILESAILDFAILDSAILESAILDAVDSGVDDVDWIRSSKYDVRTLVWNDFILSQK